MPTSQKADVRPISFILHDLAANSPPFEVPLVVRPEDLTRHEPSRQTVNQTLGGAWLDDWGPGVAGCTLSGHTGWGAGGRPDGFEQFKLLHRTVFESWHARRATAIASGQDPDLVRLIFCDLLDEFTWLVSPQSFVLKRNKARPLLSQYQISLTKLADSVVVRKKSAAELELGKTEAALSSLDSAIATIGNFADNIKGAIKAALGPIADAVKKFMDFTGGVLKTVKGLVAAGQAALRTVLSPILEIGQMLCQAARNVMGIVATIKSIPSLIRNEFMRVASAFTNAFCIFKNVFRVLPTYPDYSSVYGASNCSSTAGGRPLSAFGSSGANVFNDIFQSKTVQAVSASPAGASALTTLATMDLAMAPVGLAKAGELVTDIVENVKVKVPDGL